MFLLIYFDYFRGGLLSGDGVSRPYDEAADGFVRAETICMIFLQKSQDCKRMYAKVVHVDTNNDGYKMEGTTFPAGAMQEALMNNFYEKIKLNPRNVE